MAVEYRTVAGVTTPPVRVTQTPALPAFSGNDLSPANANSLSVFRMVSTVAAGVPKVLLTADSKVMLTVSSESITTSFSTGMVAVAETVPTARETVTMVAV